MVRNVVSPATNSVRTLLPDLLKPNSRSRMGGVVGVPVVAAWLMASPLSATRRHHRALPSLRGAQRRSNPHPGAGLLRFTRNDEGNYCRVGAAATLPGRITPQPTRNGGSRPCTGRAKVRGTSGIRSGKRALISGGGVGVVSAVSQTTTAPLLRISSGVTHGERAGSASK